MRGSVKGAGLSYLVAGLIEKPIEREVFDKFSSSSTAQTSVWLATQSIQTYSNAYEEKLQNEQLLYASQWQELTKELQKARNIGRSHSRWG
jgi:hypothetical protein